MRLTRQAVFVAALLTLAAGARAPNQALALGPADQALDLAVEAISITKNLADDADDVADRAQDYAKSARSNADKIGRPSAEAREADDAANHAEQAAREAKDAARRARDAAEKARDASAKARDANEAYWKAKAAAASAQAAKNTAAVHDAEVWANANLYYLREMVKFAGSLAEIARAADSEARDALDRARRWRHRAAALYDDSEYRKRAAKSFALLRPERDGGRDRDQRDSGNTSAGTTTTTR
jgi:hypothetical protein